MENENSNDMNTSTIIHVGPTTPGGMDTVIRFLAKRIIPSKVISTRIRQDKYSLLNAFVYIKSLVAIVVASLLRPRAVFHIHTTKNGSLIRKFLIGLILRITGSGYIAHMHAGTLGWFESDSFWMRRILYAYLSAARYVVVLSDTWKKYYLHRFPMLDNLRVIPNPCDYLLSEPPEMRESDVVRFIYAGSFTKEKGVYDLVEAFSRIGPGTRAELHMFGGGNVAALRAHVEENPKNEFIHIHDWVSHEKYVSLIRDYDVFVLPSYAEGMPMSILEAMGQAKPIIASNVGSNSLLVSDNLNGYLMHAGDIALLSKVMEHISQDFELRKSMSKKSWEIASTFSPQIILKEWTSLYAQYDSR